MKREEIENLKMLHANRLASYSASDQWCKAINASFHDLVSEICRLQARVRELEVALESIDDFDPSGTGRIARAVLDTQEPK